MKLSAVLLSLALVGLASAWEEDERCPTRRRRLGQGSKKNEDIFPTPKQSLVEHDAADTEPRVPLTKRHLQQGNNIVFHLKMYWEEGFCWQEEWRERAWCFDCDGRDCNIDDIISTQSCADTPLQEFMWIPDERKNDGRGWLKVANKDLCYERVSNQLYRLQPCQLTGNRQKFIGFSYTEPFELVPFGYPAKCISQHHDPKPDEELYGIECTDARRDFTNKWQVWWPREIDANGLVQENFPELTSEGPSCTANNPCDVCAGDCDNDGHCAGNLECFQRRSSENPMDRVPGCAGDGDHSVDYCYDPQSPAVTEYHSKLITPERECSDDHRCQACYGDCDSDDDCVGNLECYKRSTENEWEDVPGCYSIGVVGYDYCYDPDSTPRPSPNIFSPVSAPTPAPVVALTLAPVTSAPVTGSTTPAPVIDLVTTPAPVADPVTTPAPVADPVTTPAPVADPVTTPAPVADPVTTPAPVADPVTTPAPVANPVTTPAPVAASTPAPVANPVTPAPVTASTPAPVARPTNALAELISLSIDCTPELPCERCFGDCRGSDDCMGDLRCFFRSALRENGLAPVPGCIGAGIENWDYCYDPNDDVTDDDDTSIPSQAPVVTTTTAVPTSNTILPAVNTTSGSSGGYCLSGENSIAVKRYNGVAETILMKDLKVGDYVQDSVASFSRVYSFGHYHQYVETPYLQIEISKGGLDQPSSSSVLELSKEHMVFTEDDGAVPASLLAIGDSLLLADGAPAEIMEIQSVIRQGAYAPFTESGKLLVGTDNNNEKFVVSSFVAMDPTASSVTLFGGAVVSYQWLAHATQAPHRVYCKLLSGRCYNDEMPSSSLYTEDGLSHWVVGPREAAAWLVRQHEMTQVIILTLVMAMMVPIMVFEQLLGAFSSWIW